MNTRLISAITTLPLAAAGIFAFSGNAQAAGFTASLQLSNFGLPNGLSVLKFSKNKIDFYNLSNPNIPDPQSVSLSGLVNNSVFVDWTAGIRDITPLPGVGNPLVDNFLTSSVGGFNFDITRVGDYRLDDGGTSGTVGLTVFFDGLFEKASQRYQGKGNLTFQLTGNGITAQSIRNRLNAGEVFGDNAPVGDVGITFSGATVTTVPESSAFLGLGIAGLGLVAMTRRNKKNNIK